MSPEIQKQIDDIVTDIYLNGQSTVQVHNPELVEVLGEVIARMFLGCVVEIEELDEDKISCKCRTNKEIRQKRFDINKITLVAI